MRVVGNSKKTKKKAKKKAKRKGRGSDVERKRLSE